MARLKISSSLENSKILNFFKIWALNLNLFLRILPFFPFFSLYFAMKKGQNAQKMV